jgi:uroporphyrinogen-III synthase
VQIKFWPHFKYKDGTQSHLNMTAKHLLQGLNVAITRPAEQAQSLCDAIESHGGMAIRFPLIAVSALPDYQAFEQQITKLPHTDWAIFISTNAVDFALPRVLKNLAKHHSTIPENLRFAAIGHQTAGALKQYGVQKVLIPQGRYDSETLLALPEMQDVAGKTFAIFRGVGGRELMAETLKARGANVYFAESYQRSNPQQNAVLLKTKWQKSELDAVVVTSSEAMRYLLDMAGNEEWLRHITICVNHERIAELPRQLGLKVLVASAPGDEAMLQCLALLVKQQLVK